MPRNRHSAGWCGRPGRLAAQRDNYGSGRMGNFAGVQMFVPDQDTFATWIEDYLLEIQTREAGRNAE